MKAPVQPGDLLTVDCQDITGVPFHGDVVVLTVTALDPNGGFRWRCRFRRPGADAGDPFEHVQIIVDREGKAFT